MARQNRKQSSRQGDFLSSPLVISLRNITAPIARFCTISTDTLDSIVELCAGPNAINRIERARSTNLIKELSVILEPQYFGGGTWAEAVGGGYTGVREAKPSFVTPWKDPHEGVVYRYRLSESSEGPVYRTPVGSGSLYGFLLNSSSSSGPSSLQNKSPTPRSQGQSNRTIDSITEGFLNRTNLANRYRSIYSNPEPDYTTEYAPSPENFKPDATKSYIAATFALPPGKPKDVVETTIHATPSPEATPPALNGDETKPRQAHPGRRALKFTGRGAGKEGGEGMKIAVKEAEEGETGGGDCAIESCDEEDWDPKLMIEQQQRTRYNN